MRRVVYLCSSSSKIGRRKKEHTTQQTWHTLHYTPLKPCLLLPLLFSSPRRDPGPSSPPPSSRSSAFLLLVLPLLFFLVLCADSGCIFSAPPLLLPWLFAWNILIWAIAQPACTKKKARTTDRVWGLGLFRVPYHVLLHPARRCRGRAGVRGGVGRTGAVGGKRRKGRGGMCRRYPLECGRRRHQTITYPHRTLTHPPTNPTPTRHRHNEEPPPARAQAQRKREGTVRAAGRKEGRKETLSRTHSSGPPTPPGHTHTHPATPP